MPLRPANHPLTTACNVKRDLWRMCSDCERAGEHCPWGDCRWPTPTQRRSRFWSLRRIRPPPLSQVCQPRFRFSATTLTVLLVTCIGVPAVTLFRLGSLSEYLVRRRLMAGGLAAGAGGCASSLIGDGVGPLFAARVPGSRLASGAERPVRRCSTCDPMAVRRRSLPGRLSLAAGRSARSASARWRNTPPHRPTWPAAAGRLCHRDPGRAAMQEPGRARPGAAASLRPHVGTGDDEATFVAATAASTAGSSSTDKMAGRRWRRQGDAGLGLRQRAVAKPCARPASDRIRSGSAALRPIRRRRSRRRARSRPCRR
jgi:hypothetical protein